MKKLAIVVSALSAAFVAPGALADKDKFRIKLQGYQEVPVVSTAASGEFDAFIGRNDTYIDFELSYRGLQAAVRQAHIHAGQRSVNGAIVVWLCQTAANPAPPAVNARVQQCPEAGTVRGRIEAADVLGAATSAQQITDGELDEVIAAIRAGVAYVNVHTALSTGGEIRGQLGKPGNGHPGHDD